MGLTNNSAYCHYSSNNLKEQSQNLQELLTLHSCIQYFGPTALLKFYQLSCLLMLTALTGFDHAVLRRFTSPTLATLDSTHSTPPPLNSRCKKTLFLLLSAGLKCHLCPSRSFSTVPVGPSRNDWVSLCLCFA